MLLKKICCKIIWFLLFCSGLSAIDFSITLLPSWELPVDGFLNERGGFGATLQAELTPLTVRDRDRIYITGGASYTGFQVEGFGLQSFIDGGIGLGYELRFNDRFSVFAQGTFGLWNFYTAESFGSDSLSGLAFCGRGGFSWYVSPSLSLCAFGGYKSFYTQPESFLNTVEAGVGLRFSLSRGLFNTTFIEMTSCEVDPLFPVFYSHYTDNAFGSLSFLNCESNDIYNVAVYVMIDSYMTSPYKVSEIDCIKRGEGFEVPLYAFLGENILDLVQPKSSELEVTVTYYSLGKEQKVYFYVPVLALSRNSMTWEEDARAAAFVSGKDASAERFARQVQAVVKKSLKNSVPENIQYAAAMFGALKAFGINYVVDPSSAFTDNVGTASVDFLQFPYQTLLCHGGDCDDLTILNCSLLEAIGIETAFITVPGHIYMAFDSGLSAAEARSRLTKGYYIEAFGKVWIPFEITLSQDTFSLAWSYGAKEWRKAGKEAELIPLKEAWKNYLPISVPGSEASIDVPSAEEILRNFREASYY